MEKLELLKQIISLATVLLNLALNPNLPIEARNKALADSTTILHGASQMVVALNQPTSTVSSTVPEQASSTPPTTTSTPTQPEQPVFVMPQVVYVPVLPEPSLGNATTTPPAPEKVDVYTIDPQFGQNVCIAATRFGVQFRYSNGSNYNVDVTVGTTTQSVPITNGLGFLNLTPDTVYDRTVKVTKGNKYATAHDKFRTQPADKDFCAEVSGLNLFDTYWE